MKAPLQSFSNEYPQHMFSWRNKKNIYLIPTLIYTYDFKNAFNSIFSSSEYWPFQILISILKNASVLGADCFENKSVFTQNWSVKYSRTLLSRTHLFRITAYLEVKIWSLF